MTVSGWVNHLGMHTSHLGQLSLQSVRERYIENQPLWLGSRRGGFTCVGCEVTLCDLMARETPYSSEIEVHEDLDSNSS